MVAFVNALLPVDKRVDAKYVERFTKRKCSDELVSHAVLDRVEARLRAFDSVKAGRHVRDCKETWAAELIAQPGFELFGQRYESTAEQRAARIALVARGTDHAAM
jgi:hypothetical protein